MLPPLSAEELQRRRLAALDCWRQLVVEVPAVMPVCRGIFVGGCAERGVGSSFRAQGHAHIDDFYPTHYLWICLRSPKHLGTYVECPQNDGRILLRVIKPSRLLWHEYAHVISGHGHDDVWRRWMARLGQPLPKRYRKRVPR